MSEPRPEPPQPSIVYTCAGCGTQATVTSSHDLHKFEEDAPPGWAFEPNLSATRHPVPYYCPACDAARATPFTDEEVKEQAEGYLVPFCGTGRVSLNHRRMAATLQELLRLRAVHQALLAEGAEARRRDG